MGREGDNRRRIRDWTLKDTQKSAKEDVILMYSSDEGLRSVQRCNLRRLLSRLHSR